MKHDPTTILATIDDYLKKTGGRKSAARERVVLTLAQSKKPVTAYQLLATINKKQKEPMAAASLYRILDFLVEIGVVLKRDSDSSYEICHHVHKSHQHVLLVCDQCGQSQEISETALTRSLSQSAEKHKFHLKHHIVELHGVCGRC